MAAKDAARVGSDAPPCSTGDAPEDAVPAAARLRGALENAGFDVERDFTSWDVIVDGRGIAAIEIGNLGVATANRLWALLERCVTAPARKIRASPGRRGPRREESHAPEEARRAAERLRSELKRVGFDLAQDFVCCVADCTASGMGLVRLGALPTATAIRISELIEPLADGAPGAARSEAAE